MDRKHAKIYSQAENLFNLVHQPDFFNQKLATVLADLVTTFIGEALGCLGLSMYFFLTVILESFRSRTFILLSKAYTSLPLSLGQAYLGLNAEQLLSGML